MKDNSNENWMEEEDNDSDEVKSEDLLYYKVMYDINENSNQNGNLNKEEAEQNKSKNKNSKKNTIIPKPFTILDIQKNPYKKLKLQ